MGVSQNLLEVVFVNRARHLHTVLLSDWMSLEKVLQVKENVTWSLEEVLQVKENVTWSLEKVVQA